MHTGEQGDIRRLIGKSPRMRQIVDGIERMTDHRWPVLILGETGTGKELIARMIHAHGNAGPFVVIDCAAIQASLMESELFGHVKGAFTGAAGPKTGLIEAAHGGTAFFDEIGELPLELQSKLLRVLQEKEFRPVGATFSRRSDFRVIAATHRDLAVEVEKKRFRQDLFYRLKVITLRLPALRERKEDIPDLVEHFLSRHGQSHIVTPEAVQTLLAFDWPGNVRELENCIQHMVAVSAGTLLEMSDMPSTVLSQAQISQWPLLGMAAAVGDSVAPSYVNAQKGEHRDLEPILPLAELEKREILRALRFTKGDRTSAAMLLGIGRTTLYRKLKDYGFDEAGALVHGVGQS
ncbi:MAG: sigma-54-dependent Fis family transcriptional regulator [Bryobacteraceae bacterium]|nr:sigma-54-dependent Fis family transcriptional regulator [Bryobacteraceae bacterium]